MPAYQASIPVFKKNETMNDETNDKELERAENTVDIESFDEEELTVDNDFYDESDDDIDNYYSKLHKKK